MMARTGALSMIAGETGRFFGDGLTWALRLPLPELMHWRDVMHAIQGQ
jgi:hypothetical protein